MFSLAAPLSRTTSFQSGEVSASERFGLRICGRCEVGKVSVVPWDWNQVGSLAHPFGPEDEAPLRVIESGLAITQLANSWLAAGVHSLAPRSEPSDSSPPRAENPARGGGRRGFETTESRSGKPAALFGDGAASFIFHAGEKVGTEGRTALE